MAEYQLVVIIGSNRSRLRRASAGSAARGSASGNALAVPDSLHLKRASLFRPQSLVSRFETSTLFGQRRALRFIGALGTRHVLYGSKKLDGHSRVVTESFRLLVGAENWVPSRRKLFMTTAPTILILPET